MPFPMRNKKNAFSMTETVMVISILIILMVVAFISYGFYSQGAKDSKRLVDVSNLTTSVSSYIAKNHKAPFPSKSQQITYSGSNVWLQGVIDDSVVKTLGDMSTAPKDSTYGNYYSYSVLNSQKEFQIGAINETQEAKDIGYLSDSAFAAFTPGVSALLRGNYNSFLVKARNGNSCYTIAMPSIILTSTNTAELKLAGSGSVVFDKETNTPASYQGMPIYSAEKALFRDFSDTQIIVDPSNSCDYDDIKSSTGNLANFAYNVAMAYSGTLVGTLDADKYKSIIAASSSNVSSEKETIAKDILVNVLGENLKALTGDPVNGCALQPNIPFGTGYVLTGALIPSQPWMYRLPTDTAGACTFTCDTGSDWNGTLCVKTRNVSCSAKPDNSRWLTGSPSITQTLVFSGSTYTWTPDSTPTFQTGSCGFDCIGGYHLEQSGSTLSCIANVHDCAINIAGQVSPPATLISLGGELCTGKQDWNIAGGVWNACKVTAGTGTLVVPSADLLSCVKNCAASTQTVNGHTYSVPAFNHANTTAVVSSAIPTTITCAANLRTFGQTFSCTNGVVSTQGSETPYNATCGINYTINSVLCSANNQVSTCAGSIPAHAHNNSVANATSYSQIWNCTDWSPSSKSWAYSATSGGECGFDCDTGYMISADKTTCLPKPCNLPWGGSINDGQSVTAYSTATVPFDNSCASQTRTCSLGVLSGSYTFGSCAMDAASNCNASSQTVNSHSYSVPAMNHGVVTPVTSSAVSVAVSCAGNTMTYKQSFTCYNGAISTSGGETGNNATCGTNYHTTSFTCTADTKSTSCGSQPANSVNNSAGSLTTYTQTWSCGSWTPTIGWTYSASGGGSCNFTCASGYTWNGTSCAPNGCTLPWGGSINHGDSVIAYSSSSLGCGGSCSGVSQTRTCSLGVLSGSYTNSSCSVQACPVCSGTQGACSTGTPSADNGNTSCNSTRSWNCTSGGSTIGCSSSNRACYSCSLPAGLGGGTIAHGASVTAWNYSSLACDSASVCASESRSCNDGTLYGSYTNSSCSKPSCVCYSDGGCSGGDSCNTPKCNNPGTSSAYCSLVNNAINGGWTAFGSWGSCSGTSQTRSRTCTNPVPSCGGSACSGSATESQYCCATAGQPCDDGNVCTSGETIQYATCTCGGGSTAAPIDCSGNWGSCSGGVKTYMIAQNAQCGGASCSFSNGTTTSSGCPGVCGSVNGTAVSMPLTSGSSNLCSVGSVVNFIGPAQGSWQWQCSSNGVLSSTCSASPNFYYYAWSSGQTGIDTGGKCSGYANPTCAHPFGLPTNPYGVDLYTHPGSLGGNAGSYEHSWCAYINNEYTISAYAGLNPPTPGSYWIMPKGSVIAAQFYPQNPIYIVNGTQSVGGDCYNGSFNDIHYGGCRNYCAEAANTNYDKYTLAQAVSDPSTCVTLNGTSVSAGNSITLYKGRCNGTTGNWDCLGYTYTCINGALSPTSPSQANYPYDSADSCYADDPGSCTLPDPTCFLADTKISMADGTKKNIEDVNVGDEVVVYDELLAKNFSSPVTEVVHNTPRTELIYTITLDDGTIVKPNQDHPMYEARTKTYVTMSTFAKIYKEGVNPLLQKEDGSIHTISSIEGYKMTVPTYNLHVIGISNTPNIISLAGIGHNYYANGILVHNNMITNLFYDTANAAQIIVPTN